MKKNRSKKSTDKQLAAKYGVSLRTFRYSWPKMHPPAPVNDDAGMVEWAAGQPRLSDRTRSAIAKIAAKLGKAAIPADRATAAAWLQFLAETEKDAGPDHTKAMASLAKPRDFAAWMFERAAKDGDREGQRFYSALLARFEGVIHDYQLRAQKLKLDTGELYPRSDFEQIISAWTYWTMRCVDNALSALCRKVVGVPSAEEARQIIEPFLLSEKYVEPFKHAVTVATGMQLPAWFTAKLVDSIDDYIEHGAEIMEAAKASAAS